MKNIKFPFWLFLAVATYIYGSWLVNNEHGNRYIWSDAEGYYLYLPAVFIHGTFENIPVRTKFEYQPYEETNKIFTRFTYGIALMQAPFWLLAHASRWVQRLPLNDPWGTDYCVAMLFAASFYLSLGLHFFYKTVLRYFENPFVAKATAFCLFLGTNLLHYAAKEPGMSHVYTFFLVSVLFYYLPNFYQKGALKSFCLIGFLLALITLIRPTNGILYLFVLLFDIKSRKDLKNRWHWLFDHKQKLLVFPVLAFIIALPQMTYWYYLSGHFIVDSYKNTGASFLYWQSPYVYEIFFSYCNGFLLYSPIMFFALLGLLFMAWRDVLSSRLILFVFIVIAYLCASWNCWWFGGAFGYRPFVDYYPLLGLGLAYYFNALFKKHWTLIGVNVLLFGVLIMINIRLISFYFVQVEADESNAIEFWHSIQRCF